MIDIALISDRQHIQFRHPAGCVRLVRRAETELWVVDYSVDASAEKVLAIEVAGSAVTLRGRGEVELVGGTALELRTEPRLALPTRLRIGRTYVEIQDVEVYRRRQRSPLEPLDPNGVSRFLPNSQLGGPAPQTLSRWFQALAAIHRSPADSPDFFRQAAQFAVDPIGLDGAFLWRRTENRWEVLASSLPHPEKGILCNMDLLDQVATSGGTWFHSSHGLRKAGCCLDSQVAAEPAVVITPLRGADGEVTGAVYGMRMVHGRNGRRGIRHLEAHLVQLLAESVGSALVRHQHEAEAHRQRALLEQVFSPKVIEQIEREPQSLAGREQEVTVLFADLRNYTQLCQSLPAHDSYALLNQIMDQWTDAVLARDGVVIDYYGDGLSAMWNAPVPQAQHAQLACRAGLAMLEALAPIQAAWESRLRQGLRLGIGIHTGPAQVGNIGSSRRLKFGPRGTTVNLASRVEAATKVLGVPLLVTGATRAQLASDLLVLRACEARLPDIDRPVELFAVRSATTDERVLGQLRRYEEALRRYEEGKLVEAVQLLDDQCAVETVPCQFLARHIERESGDAPGELGAAPGREETRPWICVTLE